MDFLLDDYCQRLLAIATKHTVSKNERVRVGTCEWDDYGQLV